LFDGEDVTDTTFNYDGTVDGLKVSTWKSRLGVSVDNIKLYSAETETKQVSLDIYEKGQSVALSDGTDLEVGKTYVAHIEGANNYYKDQQQDIEFTIGKLNLTNAVVEGNIFDGGIATELAKKSGDYYQVDEAYILQHGFESGTYYENGESKLYNKVTDTNGVVTYTQLTSVSEVTDSATYCLTKTANSSITSDTTLQSALNSADVYVEKNGVISVIKQTSTASEIPAYDKDAVYYSSVNEGSAITKSTLLNAGIVGLYEVGATNASVVTASESDSKYYVLNSGKSSTDMVAITSDTYSASDVYVVANGTADAQYIDYTNKAVKAALIDTINTKAWTATTSELDSEKLAEYVTISLEKSPVDGSKLVLDKNKGEYVFKLAVDTSIKENKIVEGSTTFSAYNVDYNATVNFDNTKIYKNDNKYFYVDLDADEIEYFDTTDIYATYTTSPNQVTLKSKDLTIEVTDQNGKACTVDDLKTAGTYYVKAYVAKKINGEWVAGTNVAKVVVSYGKVDSSNVFVSYKGQNVDTTAKKQGIKLYYTGEDQATDFEYLVRSTNGNTVFTAGKDYTVTITTVVGGKTQEVTEIVNAGTYTVTIKGIAYTGDVSFDIVVKPAIIKSITPNYDYNLNDEESYAYTGEVITPEYKFAGTGAAASITADDYDVVYVLNETSQEIDYNNGTSEIDFSKGNSVELKEVGSYTAYFKVKDGVTNYEFADGVEPTINITTTKVFLDVPNGEWYTSYIYKANQAGYVNGYNDGFFFGPNDEIKRGDVVVILARMAGFSNVTANDKTNELEGYTNPFTDVDNGTYYSKAIAWAAHLGIVTGYGDGTFEPEQNVTREEFVTMLQRYANLCENGGAVAENATTELAKYTDGTTVCDWAQAAVAWASENEIMTGYAGTTVLDPEGAVTRAQVAKMAVTYQPKKLSSSNLIGSLY
jgi:hypothetical protein